MRGSHRFPAMIFLLILIPLTVASTPVFAQTPECIDYQEYVHLVGYLGEVSPLDLVHNGDYIYAVYPSALQVIDIQDHGRPQIVGSVAVPTGARRLSFCSNPRYVVVAGEDGLALVDLVDPTSPLVTCSSYIGDMSFPYPMAVADDLVLVYRSENGLAIYDASDPGMLVPLSQTGVPTVRDIAANGNHAYLSLSDDLIVVDFSDPTTPQVINSKEILGLYKALACDGELLCGAHFNGELHVFDLSDPENPNLVGIAEGYCGWEGPLDVAVKDQLAYIANELGVAIYDLANPEEPGQLYQGRSTGCGAIAVSDEYFYLGCGWGGQYGLEICATGNLGAAQPLPAPDFEDILSMAEMIIDDERVLILAGSLNIFNWAAGNDPELLKVVGLGDISGDVTAMALSGDIVCFTTDNSSLAFLDISNLNMPRPLPEMSILPGSAQDVVTEGPLAYVAGGPAGVLVVDLSNPNQIEIIGTLDTSGDAEDLVYSGELLYVAGGSAGLQIIDVSIPTNPVMVGSVDETDHADAVAVAGDLAVLRDSSGVIRLFDVDSPSSPQYLTSLGLPDGGGDIEIHGDFAYVTNNHHGIQVIDLSDPLHPLLVGTLPVEEATADFLYLADEALYRGPVFRIVPLQCANVSAVPDAPASISQTRILAASPNPFNPQTRITISVANPEMVAVEVFDLAGRKVATVAERMFSAGVHELDWQGRDARGQTVTSGVYVVRLKSKEGTDARKITLLR